MAAPAHHQVGLDRGPQDPRVAQDLEHGAGDALAGAHVELGAAVDLHRHVGDVADHGEQQLGDAADHLAIDEGHAGRIHQLDLDAAILLVHVDVEVRVLELGGARIVGLAAGGQHRQRAAAQQVVHAAGGSIAQAGHFGAGKYVQAATRRDQCVGGGQCGQAPGATPVESSSASIMRLSLPG